MKLTERQKSYCKVGGICALIAGILYAGLTVLAFILPTSIATYMASPDYFKEFQTFKLLFYLLKIIHIMTHCLMIGVVASFFALVRDKHAGIVSLVTIFAIIGYAVGILQNIEDLSLIPRLANQYDQGNEAIKEMIMVFGIANPSLFLISLGLPGIWFITVSIIGLSNQTLPKLIVILGILWGIGNILTAIAHTFILMSLIYLVALGAFVFAPLWGVLEGRYLLKLSKI